jgi:hypothetical protein
VRCAQATCIPCPLAAVLPCPPRSASIARGRKSPTHTNPAGTAALANSSKGIEVAAPGNTVGGSTSAARNVISGNFNDGVLLDSGSTGVLVQGNFIGTTNRGNGRRSGGQQHHHRRNHRRNGTGRVEVAGSDYQEISKGVKDFRMWAMGEVGDWASWTTDDRRNLLTLLFADASPDARASSRLCEGRDGVGERRAKHPRRVSGANQPDRTGWLLNDVNTC